VDRSRGSRKLTYVLFLLLLVVLAVLVLRQIAETNLRAAAVLERVSDPKAHGPIADFAAGALREEDGSALVAEGPMQFRLYIPEEGARHGGIVLLHGVHHLGINDPRMINLSRALAGAGVEVMTPELQDLADYRITPRTIDTIGASAVILSTRLKQRVGVIGLSFAGSLSLMAAARPGYADKIGFVLAVGGYEDMARVARFYTANVETRPDGKEIHSQAHEYGALLLAYAHLEDFFSSRDVPIAREALRQWLWEDPQAMKTAEALSPQGKNTLNLLLHHRNQLQQDFATEIAKQQADLDAVSPRGKLGGLKTRVYLLHGASDNIIPPAETLWLERDVPKPALKRVLISQALTHVNAGNGEPLSERWALVHFFAAVLQEADQLSESKAGR
jgi:pimeloyl-ACP methyl ester carboxylesterase